MLHNIRFWIITKCV